MCCRVHSGFNIVCAARYNLILLPRIKSIPMLPGGDNPLSERRVLSVKGITIVVAVLAITLSLAGRVFHGQFFPNHSAHSSSHQVVQHRDTDAAEWVPPVCTLVLLWGTEQSEVIDPSEPPYPREQFQSLYNRPPPLS